MRWLLLLLLLPLLLLQVASIVESAEDRADTTPVSRGGVCCTLLC
jgi:hypothetical protein